MPDAPVVMRIGQSWTTACMALLSAGKNAPFRHREHKRCFCACWLQGLLWVFGAVLRLGFLGAALRLLAAALVVFLAVGLLLSGSLVLFSGAAEGAGGWVMGAGGWVMGLCGHLCSVQTGTTAPSSWSEVERKHQDC